jgi:hypothetical protein
MADTVFMVRVEVAGIEKSGWNIWFADAAERDAFLAKRQAELIVTDICEYDTNTAETALAGMDEHIAEQRGEASGDPR